MTRKASICKHLPTVEYNKTTVSCTIIYHYINKVAVLQNCKMMEKAISKSSKEREKIRAVYTKINQWQGKNKGAGVETRGELFAVLRRLRHQLLLRKSKVSEPTPALIKLGRLRLQAKKGGWIHAFLKDATRAALKRRLRLSAPTD